MSASRQDEKDIEALFEKAMTLQPGEQRREFVGGECADDPGVRSRLEELVSAAEDAGDFLPETPRDSGVALASHQARIGDRIGRYKLLERVGEGGCGVVYVAEQEEPVKRRVALKVIRAGMDTSAVVARF